MAMTRERFEQGLTYEHYKAQMTRNRDRLEANEQAVVLSEAQVEFFAQLPQPLDVLVITEDWCESAIANLPVLVRLAAETGQLNLRFFLRDQNPEMMNQYLKYGLHRTIPTIVFFGPDFHEVGIWVEGPALIAEMQTKGLQELFTSHPAFAGLAPGTPFAQLPEAVRAQLRQAFIKFQAETHDLSVREVVREMRELIEHGLTVNA